MEFTRLMSIAEMGGKGKRLTVEAVDGEKQRLAERFGLIEVVSLRASVRAQDQSKDRGVLITGTMEASVVQPCVVSGKPVAQDIACDIHLRLVGPEELERLDADEAFLDPEAEEYDALPEQGDIDMGEIIAQTLSMSLDPFPRAEDAEIPGSDLGGKISVNEAPLKKENPFSVLKDLKEKS